jgi:broad specificity phosphatase PhoE
MSILASPMEDYLRLTSLLPEDITIVSSPIPRVRQTAMLSVRAIMNYKSSGQTAPETPIIIRPDLREQSFGSWVNRKRIDLKNESSFQQYIADPVNIPPPNGENLKDFKDRIIKDFNKMAGVYRGKNVAVFGHAGGIRVITAEAKEIDMKAALKLPVDPLSLTIVTHDSEKKAQGKNPWTLETLNLKP